VAIQQRELANGLCVIVEEMDHVESAAYELSIPGGLISDPEANIGASLVLAELIGKGAGMYDTRGLSEAFDSAGIRHGEGAGTDRFSLSGVLVANQVERALELVTAMVREPKLPKEDIEPIASILLQDLDSLKDNPARRAMVELSSRFYPAPFNRCPMGEPDGIAGCDRDLLQRMHADMFRPKGAILSIAGKVSAERIFATVSELLGDWSGVAIDLPKFGTRPKHEYFHLTEKSAQAQIVMAAPSAKFSDPLYYESKLVASILGSSMFGRLFVEVREKRGLCYSVYARHGSNLQYGTLSAYVGTTPERAQESMDVVLNEFEKLPGTITQEELDRSRTNLKSSLIMGEESPGSRASSNASDWWLIKRVRGLEEIKSAIDSVTLDSINQFLKKYPFRPCSVLTLGSAPLKVPASVFTGQAQ
jgi:predicted Zn-dependent peptidase